MKVIFEKLDDLRRRFAMNQSQLSDMAWAASFAGIDKDLALLDPVAIKLTEENRALAKAIANLEKQLDEAKPNAVLAASLSKGTSQHESP